MWKPQPRQEIFLKSSVYEVGYGGAKGGGKSDSLLADATAQLPIPGYKCILFRRTYKELQDLMDRADVLFTGHMKWSGDDKRWTAPNGSWIMFSHCEHEKDKLSHQGKEYHYIGFDQLEAFTLTMYEYIIAQNRTSNPKIKCYVRSTFNPGNIGHGWVKKRFIDTQLNRDGIPQWFKKINEIDTAVPMGTPGALSRAFVFSSLWDNKILMESDPDYISRLEKLPEASRKALLFGDWDAFEGQYFAEWARDVHVIPHERFKRMADEMPCTRFIASDYGFAKQSSTGWYAAFPDGQIIKYRELYKAGLTYEALADEVLTLTQSNEDIDYWVIDPAVQGDKSHHVEPKDGQEKGKSGFDIINEVVGGKFSVMLADNRRIVGWTRIHEYLKPYINQHGEKVAMFQCTDNCFNLIRTLPIMVFSQSNPEDLDTTLEDHAVDETRYAIMSRVNFPTEIEKPKTHAQQIWALVSHDLKKHNNNLTDEEDEGNFIDEGTEIEEPQ